MAVEVEAARPARPGTPEAPRFRGLSVRTLERHRTYATWPTYSKIGGRIIYPVSDLREWVERGASRSTS
jgi:hypothetical protein